VVVVGDAVTDRSAAAHEHVVERVLPALGRVESTSDVLSRVGAGR